MKRAGFDFDDSIGEDFIAFPLYNAFEEEGLVNHDDNQRLQAIHNRYKAGEIPYAIFVHQTLEIGAMALKDKPESAALRITTEFLQSDRASIFEYIPPSLDHLRAVEFELFVITAEPEFVAHAAVKALGLYGGYGTEFGLKGFPGNRRFTGEVVRPLGSSVKKLIAQNLKKGADIFVAVGDSDGDLGMLEEATHPTHVRCIRPKDTLRVIAEANGWPIIEDPHQAVNIFADL